MTLRLNGSTSGYVEIDAPAVAGTSVLTLPTGTGTLATTTDAGLQIVSPSSIANSGGSASASGGAVSFTGVSSVSLNGVFTSAYDNYRIVLYGIGTNNTASTRFRFRASGVDNSSSNYQTHIISSVANIAGVNRLFGGAVSSPEVAWLWSAGGMSVIDVCSPALSGKEKVANFTASTIGSTDSVHATGNVMYFSGPVFDGFSLIRDSGSSTGTIRVYGYKNS